MPEEQLTVQEERDSILTWATVFEKDQFSTGGIEIVVTLINISESVLAAPEAMDAAIAERLKDALRHSKILDDDEIMDDVIGTRPCDYPDTHWWWWPEKL